jgi:Fe-S cluster assembly iron-binding protein IscA
MDITRRALKRIERLRSRGEARRAAVRVAMDEGLFYIHWDFDRPELDDIVVMRGGLPLFVDARTYETIGRCRLDFAPDAPDGRGFRLRSPRDAGGSHRHYRFLPSVIPMNEAFGCA